MIKFNQKVWLETIYWYEYRAKKNQKNDFEKEFSKVSNNSVFGGTMENVRKHSDIKLVTIKKEETTWCQNQIMVL